MKLYATPITIELLKKHNRIFFENATFHGDISYKIIKEGELDILRIYTKLTGIVHYKIDKDNYNLTYITL